MGKEGGSKKEGRRKGEAGREGRGDRKEGKNFEGRERGD